MDEYGNRNGGGTGGVAIAAGIISAALIGGLIYAFIRHTKLFLLILLGLIVLTVGLVAALAYYDRYGRGFKTVQEKNLQKRLDALIIRIRRARRFSQSSHDIMVNSDCEQLMQLANQLMKAIKETPDSPQKQQIMTQQLDELELTIGKLEQLNLMTATMDAGQMQMLQDDFQLSLDAMHDAQTAVYGTALPEPEKPQEQFYTSEQ